MLRNIDSIKLLFNGIQNNSCNCTNPRYMRAHTKRSINCNCFNTDSNLNFFFPFGQKCIADKPQPDPEQQKKKTIFHCCCFFVDVIVETIETMKNCFTSTIYYPFCTHAHIHLPSKRTQLHDWMCRVDLFW